MEFLEAPLHTKVGLLCRLRKPSLMAANLYISSSTRLAVAQSFTTAMASSPESYIVTYNGRMRASAGQCCENAGVWRTANLFCRCKSPSSAAAPDSSTDLFGLVVPFFFFSLLHSLISPIAIGFRLGIA